MQGVPGAVDGHRRRLRSRWRFSALRIRRAPCGYISEQLDCKPIQFFVHRHIRAKYACRQCQTVTAEPLPAQVIDKGMAAPGLLAQVLISKYQDHQPLYRQETLYQP